MVQSAGLEPATFWTATRCSNPLSYDCMDIKNVYHCCNFVKIPVTLSGKLD
jgi:hypothetical protein